MVKLDKSKKMCAFLLTGTLMFPTVGCTHQKYDGRLSYSFSDNDICITDNLTDIKVILSDKEEEKIMSGEDITIIFDDHYIDIDEDGIKKIRELIDKRDSNNKILLVVLTSLGLMLNLPFLVYRHNIIKFMGDDELCEENRENKYLVKRNKKY